MFLALGCVGFLSSPALAEDVLPADDAQSGVQRRTDADIVVTGARDERELESPKATSDLLDTSQTITIISDQVLRRQNLLTLRDALATIPGITFGAGEGGGGYGDSINLRGYSASNDITQDGARDGAQYSRTDPFNLQQIEIYNGANSVFNGSGSVGGTINLVSKVPRRDNLTILSGAIGTDDYFRGTVDGNRRISPQVAIRLNAMLHGNDVPGRDVEHYRRWGIAPAITFGIDGPTSLTLAYVHQSDDNIPIYGVPYFLNQLNDGPLPEADDSDYFGYRNLDEQEARVDRLTATLRQDITDRVSLRSLARWQKVDQYTQTSSAEGIWCLTGTGRQPVPADATASQGLACPAGLAPGFYRPSGPRGRVRDQSNELWYSQTDVRVESGRAGALHNILVFGASFGWEDYGIETAELARNPDGSAFTPLPIDSIADPAALYTGPINYTVTARSRGDSNNQAIYAFDTFEIGPMFELNAGVRYEWAEATFVNVALPAYPPGTVPLTAAQRAPQISDDRLFSYRFGAVFKPTPQTSLYVAYGNARTPTSATVRLGCGTPAAAGAPDPCRAAPETARNYELGAKADLLNRRLQLTAALFRNERSNFRIASNDPIAPTLQVVDGRSRVDGLALGVSGNVTPEWSLFANYTWLDGEVLQSVSDFCLANPRPDCLNSAAIPDPQAGDRLIQTPRHSGSLFTTYRLPFGLQIGYGLTYQGGFATHQRNLLLRTQYFTGDFLIHRAFLSYEIRTGLTAQLNVSNFTDERYFTNVRNNANVMSGAVTGGWAAPGEGRSAVLSLFYSF
ncbi:MAG: catecholate siderophore receptor [Sphingomonadales bacterium]|jgi:catecholate siderophore receptor|nr:catecholate siderophore receptor [Sphingomonadales bacterium]